MSDTPFEKVVWEDGRYTLEISKTNASVSFGPSIGLFCTQVQGPQVGSTTWINVQASEHPVSKRMFVETLEALGVTRDDMKAVLSAIPDKKSAYEEIARRLQGLTVVADVKKVASRRTSGKYFNSIKVVERLDTVIEHEEGTEATDILDVLDI